MYFNNIKQYDEKLLEISYHINKMEKIIKKNPDKKSAEINLVGLKKIYEILSEEREEFLKIMNQNANMHIYNDVRSNDFSLYTLSEILNFINELTGVLCVSLKNTDHFNFNQVLPIKNVSSGSLHLSFSMGDEKTDLREVRLNYDIFNALFDILSCRDEELSLLKHRFGNDCVVKYEDLLNFLIENELNLVLENSARKVELSHDDAYRVYNLLKKSNVR